MNLPFPNTHQNDIRQPDYQRERNFWRDTGMDLTLDKAIENQQRIFNLSQGIFQHELSHVLLGLGFLKNGYARRHQGSLGAEYYVRAIEAVINGKRDISDDLEENPVVHDYVVPKYLCIGNYIECLLWIHRQKTGENTDAVLNSVRYEEDKIANLVEELGGTIITPMNAGPSTRWRINIDGAYYQYDSTGEYENKLPEHPNFTRYKNPSNDEIAAMLETLAPALALITSKLPATRDEEPDYEGTLGTINLRDLAQAIGIPTPAIPFKPSCEAC